MSKIKVIHYIPGFNMGGIESRLVDWYREIDRNKIEFIVIKNNNIESEKLKEFVSLGGRFYNLPHLELKKIKIYLNKLKEILKKENPDIIHVHTISVAIFPLYIAKQLGIKTRILHSRTTSRKTDKNKFVKTILHFLAIKYATDYFACSIEAGLWAFGKKNINNVKVIKNGIYLEKFNFDETIRNKMRENLKIKNNIVIGSVSRLCEQKNILFLIDIFNEIYKINNNYKMILVGEGDLRKKIENKINLLKLSDAIKLVGAHSDVWNYYMAFDIFLGTSSFEGFGTTAIEAQATGLPSVLSTGFPETVEVTDFVKRLALEDDTKIWAREILNMKRRNRSKEDTKKIDDAGFSAKSVAKELERFYYEHAKEKDN